MGEAVVAALDDLVDRSAAPTAAAVAVERLAAAHPELTDRLTADRRLAEAVVTVCAASRSLTVLVETDAEAIDVLATLDHRRAPPADGDADVLRRWKQHEYLRIAARDLLGLDDLVATGAALADLAAGVLAGAHRLVGSPPLAVVGMGKLGGCELNYASDIDVMFVGRDGSGPGDDGPGPVEADRAARQLMAIARESFRVDANLRPEGRDGPLVRTVESYEAYWERWAQPWEFQALLKARAVVGAPELGQAFAGAVERHLWQRSFSADDLRSLRAMKASAEQDVERRRLADRELKRAAGGIRDIEFTAQLLQLVHGRHDPALRSRSTLELLTELGDAGYVDDDDAASLAEAYRFLRAAEHRVQLVDGQQVHSVPGDDAARGRLARVMGYRDSAATSALEAFDVDLRRWRATVRAIHERVYFRPLLEAFSSAESRLSPEAAAARLTAFGFAEADRTRQAVQELTRGLTRTSRLMHQLLPLILGWLSESPDPDLGLLGLRTLASGDQRSRELVRAFRESTEAARRLCTVAGTSRLLTDVLQHNPDLIAELADDRQLEPRTREQLLDAATRQAWRDDPEEQRSALRRLKEREFFRVAARDLVGLGGVDATAADLTALAEATVEAALDVVSPAVPFTVVAMGRFGGAELSFASDLDVLFVYDGTTASDFEEAERAATALLRFLAGTTPSGRIYPVDADLRPEGRQGPLARSVEGFGSYFERWAQVWERQAMTRARIVAGDPQVGERFLSVVGDLVWCGLDATDVREIRRIKARVEKERIPAGEDAQFHLKLGRGSLSDVEFTVQLLQLRHGVQEPGTMTALAKLAAADVISAEDTEVLAAAYRFCERTRNRLYLVQGGPGDSLPQRHDQLAKLARSLDTSPGELREHYRRVTRRCRGVVERLFYGRG